MKKATEYTLTGKNNKRSTLGQHRDNHMRCARKLSPEFQQRFPCPLELNSRVGFIRVISLDPIFYTPRSQVNALYSVFSRLHWPTFTYLLVSI